MGIVLWALLGVGVYVLVVVMLLGVMMSAGRADRRMERGL